MKKNGKARHIGMVVKDSLGNSYIAQSNGTGKSSSDCTKNYGPTRGPRFFNLSAALASSNFGDNYGIVRIEAEKKLDFNTCYFDLAVGGQYNYIAIDTSYTLGTDILLGAVYTGSFSGNTFNATYSEAGGPETTITGSIKAVIDDNQTKIESFDWSEQWINTTSTISKACKAQNITLYSSDDASILFFIGGLNITDHIITLNDEQTSNGLNYTIDDFWGEEDSYIYVEFYSD